MVRVLREWKAQGEGPRRELLRRLARIEGLYVPSFYEVAYNDDGTIRQTRPVQPEAPARPRRRSPPLSPWATISCSTIF